MNSSNNIKLPQNTEELRDFLRKGIERYIGSPVKKVNKLNESLAAGLDFNNYDSLAPLIQKELTINTYSVEIEDFTTFVNGIKIRDIVFEEQQGEYSLTDREEFINDLERWIGEAHSCFSNIDNSNLEAWRETLKYILSISDEYVWTGYGNVTDVVAASDNPEEFNRICEETLEYNEEAKNEFEKLADELVKKFENKVEMEVIITTSKHKNKVSNIEIDEDNDLSIYYETEYTDPTYYVNLDKDSFAKNDNGDYIFTSAEYGELILKIND